jgi:hypothetical protein
VEVPRRVCGVSVTVICHCTGTSMKRACKLAETGQAGLPACLTVCLSVCLPACLPVCLPA